jgi:hypothetical protein
MSNHDDPVEFVGVNASVKADPISQAQAPTGKRPGSHSKIAIVRPRKEYAAAQVELAEARVELIAATSAAAIAVRAEGEAMAAFIVLNKPPTYDAINRERLAKIQEERAARAAAGEPLNPALVYRGNKSPLDIAAAARGRRPTTSLRSTTIRR